MEAVAGGRRTHVARGVGRGAREPAVELGHPHAFSVVGGEARFLLIEPSGVLIADSQKFALVRTVNISIYRWLRHRLKTDSPLLSFSLRDSAFLF